MAALFIPSDTKWTRLDVAGLRRRRATVSALQYQYWNTDDGPCWRDRNLQSGMSKEDNPVGGFQVPT
jgi:hypothetical protein